MALSHLASAQLSFDSSALEFERKSSDEKIEVTFPFQNRTDKPVEIADIKTSCGCTKVDLRKRIYEPGERGAIATVFRFGYRTGKQTKAVRVSYAERGVPEEQLVLTVNIVPPVLLKPTLVFWRKGSTPEPKRIEVTLDPDLNLKLKEVKAVNRDFNIEIQAKESGRYVIEVTPRSTESAQSAAFEIVAVGADSKHAVPLYAKIR